MVLREVSNMGCTPEAIDAFHEGQDSLAPGKAVNAGGVATSVLKCRRTPCTSAGVQEVDEKLHAIMHAIHAHA